MGNLPQERLEVYAPAFTNTAVDYFEPFTVSHGRGRTVKRHGALFSCLITRAVHLDLAHSLSTEDLLLVFRRFIAAHCRPIKILSDNGNNFVGTERELLAEVRRLGFTQRFKQSTSAKEWNGNFSRHPRLISGS